MAPLFPPPPKKEGCGTRYQRFEQADSGVDPVVLQGITDEVSG